MARQSLSESESVARSMALKAPKTADEQLLQEQIDYLQRQGKLQSAQQTILDLERVGETLHNQSRRMHNMRERLRILLDVALALIAVVAAGVAAELIYAAAHAENVVVGAFDVPPSMEAQGLSGKVVAAGLLDQLQKLQAETHSSVAKRGVTDAWSEDVKLEIPEAHISVGDLERYLREWLGNETHISGSIVQQGPDNTVALTVRGSGFPAKTFSGRADTLPALTVQAAEYIYGASEPYLYGTYLSAHGRPEETIAVVTATYGSALPSDRPLLLNIWGMSLSYLGRNKEALDKYRDAVALKPDFWSGYNNIMFVEAALQDEEAVVLTGQQMEGLARRGSWFAQNVSENLFQNLDTERWDLPAIHRELVQDMAENGGHGSAGTEDAPVDAQTLAQMHDWRTAELELQTSPGAGSDPFVIAQTDFVHGLIALDRGDYAAALPALSRTETAVVESTDLASQFIGPSCWLALAEEWSGQRAEADADIDRGGHLVDCYRLKADISDHRGDWALAQKQYGEAAALAPSIPSAYFSWGNALARHGDFDGAIARFKEANARGSHWADPLKGWGDALAAKEDYQGAAQKYGEAEAFAPNWGALHLRWGQALDKLGRRDRALEQFRKALDLDLTDADRKSLEGCCG